MDFQLELGEVKVLNDLLPEDLATRISSVLLDSSFPWYWCDTTLGYKGGTYQFNHAFIVEGHPNSSYIDIAVDIMRAAEKALGVQASQMSRAKANLLCSVGDVEVDQTAEIHTDLDEDTLGMHSLVYYIGESDGDTIMFSESGEEIQHVSHKNNSAAVFNSMNLHRGSLPRKHKRRVVVNIVFRADIKPLDIVQS